MGLDHNYTKPLELLGAECVSDLGNRKSGRSTEFRTFLQERDFDVAILSYYYIFNFYAPFIRAFLPNCMLILDTVDLHHVRLEREAALTGNAIIQREAWKALREETAAILHADSVWVVTEEERVKILRDVCNDARVEVVPNIHRVEEKISGYSERNGIVFLGVYGHRPNVDAVRYFMGEVYPLLQDALPNFHLTIAGSNPPSEFLNYQNTIHNIRVTGYVKDHRALLLSHLVGIAPLRYGAGMKGKIGEYLACGLPCVTSTIGAEGMGLQHGRNVLIEDDARQFAHAIVMLSQNPSLWEALSKAGVDYIKSRLSPEAISPIVLGAICVSRREFNKINGTPPYRLIYKVLQQCGNLRKVWRLSREAVHGFREGGLSELVARGKVWAKRVCIANRV